MNHENIRKALSDFDKNKVDIFINYLGTLESENWFKGIKDEALINAYKKVAKDSLSIDGDMVTLQYKGGMTISYDYHAYKNRVLNTYPESKIDHQIIYKGDEYSFHKDSGKVIYMHKINNPFDKNREIMGAYCIIKNSRGEFIETINQDDITKFRNSAKMKAIWDAWPDRMVLKSVIKRACSSHFYDIVQNMEEIDNENYSPENANFEELIQTKIEQCKTFDELSKLYAAENDKVTDKNAFLKLLGQRKAELQELLPAITADEYPAAIEMAKTKGNLEAVKLKWKLTSDQEVEIRTGANI